MGTFFLTLPLILGVINYDSMFLFIINLILYKREKKTIFYLDASMTAQIKIKFCWMANFWINNSPWNTIVIKKISILFHDNLYSWTMILKFIFVHMHFRSIQLTRQYIPTLICTTPVPVVVWEQPSMMSFLYNYESYWRLIVWF